MKTVLATLALVLLAAAPARAWWNSDWSNRMKITANAGPAGAAVTDPIGRTQILLRLQSGNFNFATAKEDGADLRVIAADDKTPLKFHIEKFDGLVDQVGFIWIDVPDLAPGVATSVYLYWGNKNATPGGDPKQTYDATTALVYHFVNEDGVPRDITANGNTATTAGKRDDGGMIGYGLKLDGAKPVQIPASPSLQWNAGQAMTWSLWERFADGQKSGVLLAARDGQNALTVGIDNGVAYAQLDTPAGTQRSAPGTPVPAEGWHFIAVEATDKITVYVDGQDRGSLPAALPAMNAASQLGGAITADAAAGATPDQAAAPAVNAAPNFNGLIDEYRVTRAARPLGALKIAVASEGPTPKLLTLDVAEESSPFGSGYFGIILKSVTIDAWVVIGILMVMALISWVVMAGKAVYISGCNGANRVFRREFASVAKAAEQDPRAAFATMKPTGRLRRSPLFRLYNVAASELHERLADGRLAADGVLSPQSLAAIRSALDAQLSRETQRLNRLMVLLTIAISGGPFLGLLGTVVGVMITFAAIAQAGDVNVNSIAPGISAALLATVAGLAVAIPALFGYNYFLTRIRDVATELAVYVDDLVTRMGEGFRGGPAPRLSTQVHGQDMEDLVDALLVRLTDSIRGLRPVAGETGLRPQPGE